MSSRTSELVRHSPSGLLIDVVGGKVFGPSGSSVERVSRNDPYIRVLQRLPRGRLKTWYAHRLVWEAAHDLIASGMQIDHLDGDPANNAICNLALVTGAENRRRQRERCLAKYGTSSISGKLTVEEVEAIRATGGGVPAGAWARRLGVDAATIRRIRKRGG
ncbi:MAG: HNH endonuclease signature motif containing protein [Stenotrophomonas sp.]|uniref:HNH endonuclease signature motif containing protein n=1 Tax=Stenotrophomonas sp. TaxID=69392 RepID=UPI003D6C9D53